MKKRIMRYGKQIIATVYREEIAQIFRNNSDCYADTGTFENDGSYREGEVIQAMTEERFVEVVYNLSKPYGIIELPANQTDNENKDDRQATV